MRVYMQMSCPYLKTEAQSTSMILSIFILASNEMFVGQAIEDQHLTTKKISLEIKMA
jgi:hypothetical protein